MPEFMPSPSSAVPAPGTIPHIARPRKRSGEGLAEAGIRLVYGGGRIGLMGIMADAALAAGGEVIGVIPEFLTRREVAHAGITELHRHRLHAQPQAAHVRGRPMHSSRCRAALAHSTRRSRSSPGASFGLHDKPILICDVAGSAAPFLADDRGSDRRRFRRP